MKTKAIVIFWALAFAAFAKAETLFVENWVFADSHLASGDLWSFTCPKGGRFTLFIDEFTTQVDPAFEVMDKTGARVAMGDDEVACSSDEAGILDACGEEDAGCPRVVNAACGAGGTHYIAVWAWHHPEACNGGSYRMYLEVIDAKEKSLPARSVKLGGGPKTKLPKFIDEDGKPSLSQLPAGPVINDGQIFPF